VQADAVYALHMLHWHPLSPTIRSTVLTCCLLASRQAYTQLRLGLGSSVCPVNVAQAPVGSRTLDITRPSAVCLRALLRVFTQVCLGVGAAVEPAPLLWGQGLCAAAARL
jgi:hypothetical protein